MEPTTAIIPTLGRSTLEAAKQSLQPQSIVLTKLGPEDTLIKIKEAVNEATTDTVVIADDDAVYPEGWVEELGKAYAPSVGFVGGPCLPLLDDASSDAEKCIAEVTSSFWGTTSMSYRTKAKGRIRGADETNLIENGLYRKDVLAKILNEEFDRIPPSQWGAYVWTRMHKMGYTTMFNPQAKFYHKQRTNVFSFAKQIFRSGTGRMAFFRQFPQEILNKFYIFLPMLFVVYLILFFSLAAINLPISGLPLVAYVAFLLLISYGFNKHKSRTLPLYYLTMHISYGFGMLVGLFRSQRKWT